MIGGGNRPNRPDRPIIGGGNNNNIIGGGNNINVGNNWGGNRPGWGYNRPGWGYNRPGYGGNWGNHWHDHHVNWHHNNWYHGCWSGHWGNNWYAPLAWGAVGWGLGTLTTSWGYPYAYSYANPYYVSSSFATPVYDYSQPIVINDYSTSNVDYSTTDNSQTTEQTEVAPPEDTPEQQQAYELSNKALASFKAGNYSGASAQIQQAIAKVPNDPVLHELSALCMFAMQDYAPAAAVLNNLMAVAPGMDWTTLSSLYPSVDVYEKQLDALDSFCQSHPKDAGAHFVLAYHRLICGESDAAVQALEVVVKEQPKDVVSQRMLQALRGDEPPAPAAPAGDTPAEQVAESDAPTPTTDLIGPWQAKRDDAIFSLELDEDGNFAWKSVVKGQDPVELKGTYTLANDLLILESGDQGTMVGQANPIDADRFSFRPVDSPPSDTGLSFGRIKR